MKKGLIVLTILILSGGAGYLIYKSSLSKCDQLYKQYGEFLTSKDDNRYRSNSLYRREMNAKLKKQQYDAASACLHENKPDIAIMMFKSLIESENGPQFVLDQRTPRISPQVTMVALYYGRLAEAYGKAGDEGQKSDALKKQKEYQDEANRLKKRERAAKGN
jgi:predicted Zn-dependent protease